MARAYWIRSPGWDIALFALPWFPLAALLFARLEDTNSYPATEDPLVAGALAAVLAVDMGHRLYTFPVAYADRTVFLAHRTKLLLAPFAVAAVVLPLRASGASEQVMAALVLWNVWHVVTQRIGLLRIYAGKLGGAWQQAGSARLDRVAVWALLGLTLLVAATQESANSTGDGQVLGALLAPWVAGYRGVVGAVAVCVACGACALWLRRELAERIEPQARLPRMIFAASTAGLLMVPIVSPLIGVLCLKLSHAIEYISFVHLYEATKHRDCGPQDGPFARLVSRPLAAVPVFFLAFCILVPRLDLPVVIMGLVAPLHFLYDGWIWKLRRREVRAPLSFSDVHPGGGVAAS